LVAVEAERDDGLGRGRAVLEQVGDRLEAPVAAAELAEDLDGRVRVHVVERHRLEQVVQGAHEVAQDRAERRVEELGREVIDAELERPQALADELRAGPEGVNERLHQVAEVRQEVGQPDGDRQAELDKKVAPVRLGMEKEVVERVEHLLEDRQDLLVEGLEAASADRAEEGAQNGVVDGRLGRPGRKRERVGDELGEMRNEDGLVVLGKRVDGHEGELEELERERAVLLILLAKRLEPGHQVLEQDGDELVRDVLQVGDLLVLGHEERLRDREDVAVPERLLDEKVHAGRPDLLEDVVVKVEENLDKEVERLLLVARVLDWVVKGEQARLGLEQPAEQLARRRGGAEHAQLVEERPDAVQKRLD
jgi:hypothetical protein